MEKVNKKELIERVSERLGMTKSDALIVFETVIDEIVSNVVAGKEVSVPGFGVFSSKVSAARVAYVPSTREAIEVPAKRSPKFRAAKAYKDAVNNL